jgi:hypothetical protein
VANYALGQRLDLLAEPKTAGNVSGAGVFEAGYSITVSAEPRPGYIFISSAQHGVAPRESTQLRNGVFTHYFVEGMRGPANPGRKTVTAQQAFIYAATRTSAYEPGQSPQFINNRGKNFNLTKH